jgi:DNA-binding NtrC family response regulator
MTTDRKIEILLVEDNKDFAKLVQVYLQRYEKDRFAVTWKENHTDAMAELESGKLYDVVLMDYFLPGKNGLEITKEMVVRKIDVPVVFLTVNKDFELALEVMKLGAADYLVKEEISSPVLPKTVLAVIEKRGLTRQLLDLEVSRQRLRAIRETLNGVVEDFEKPLHEMRTISQALKTVIAAPASANYVRMIDENVLRIIDKLERLKTLKADKTVKYIKDIKMIDLS